MSWAFAFFYSTIYSKKSKVIIAIRKLKEIKIKTVGTYSFRQREGNTGPASAVFKVTVF